MNELLVPMFTKEDFEESTRPYEFIVSHSNNDFTRQQVYLRVCKIAEGVEVLAEFQDLWKRYLRATGSKIKEVIDANVFTDFPDQPIELRHSDYECNDTGVWCRVNERRVNVIFHPLTITKVMIDYDTGAQKVQLAFYRQNRWKFITVDRRTIAGASQILDLATQGVAVNSENAKLVVKYLGDLEAHNEDLIPVVKCVGRLGWINSNTFMPYARDIEFNGDDQAKKLYRSLSSKGSYDVWLETVRKIRAYEKGLPARVILAASFASTLVKPLGCLSFFTHLWSSASSTGKTVALKVAASVWGNPDVGEYIQTFNSTSVGMEFISGYLNSLPLALDEFQLSKNKEAFETAVYSLAEGAGRLRGNKVGGVRNTTTWANCVISSGESPITNFVKGAGAFNRIVEVECTGSIFEDPVETTNIIREHYGHAGKIFVGYMTVPEVVAISKEKYQDYYKQLVGGETTDKQAMAAALLLTADDLATKWIFDDDRALTVSDLANFLHTKTEVDTGQRAYDYLCDLIAANAYSKFNPTSDHTECWGKFSDNRDKAYLIRSVFDRLCAQGGYASRSILSWLCSNDLAETSEKDGKTVPTKVIRLSPNMTSRCVVMRLPKAPLDDSEEFSDDYI